MNVALLTWPEIGWALTSPLVPTKHNRKINAHWEKMLGCLQKTGGYQQIADPKWDRCLKNRVGFLFVGFLVRNCSYWMTLGVLKSFSVTPASHTQKTDTGYPVPSMDSSNENFLSQLWVLHLKPRNCLRHVFKSHLADAGNALCSSSTSTPLPTPRQQAPNAGHTLNGVVCSYVWDHQRAFRVRV